MSKTLDQLKQTGKYTAAYRLHHSESQLLLSERNVESQVAAPLASPAVRDSHSEAKYLTTLIFGILVFISFALNISLFMMLKNYSHSQDVVVSMVADIQKLSQNNEKQAGDFSGKLKSLSTDLQGINIKLSEARASMAELTNSSETQKTAIDNLTKAKNTLFSRISELEAGFEKMNESIPKLNITPEITK